MQIRNNGKSIIMMGIKQAKQKKGNIFNLINYNSCGFEHVYRNCPAYDKYYKNYNDYYHFAKLCKNKRQCEEYNKIKKTQEI